MHDVRFRPAIVLPPVAISAVGLLLWWRFGFEPLDRWELPLAAAINGATGRSELFDHAVIFLNHWWGEGLFVLIIFAAFCLLGRYVNGPGVDWRRVALFAGFTFVVWVGANAVGDQILERYLPRDSPSYALGPALVDLEEVRGRDVKTASRSSFPSNHGSVFFTVFFMALLRWGRAAWVLFPLCVVLSLPRCFTGAHWVSDTLIGSALVTWTVASLVVATPLWGLYRRAEDRVIETVDARLGLEPPGPQM